MSIEGENALETALKNAIGDRGTVEALVVNISGLLYEDGAKYERIGMVLGKYLDNLQKSNEQIIKIGVEMLKTVPVIEDEEETDSDAIYAELKEARKEE